MRLRHFARTALFPALLGAALPFAAIQVSAIQVAASAQPAGRSSSPNDAPAQSLRQANTALQAGEADKALALLSPLPASGPGLAQGHNLVCRVRLTLEQWDAAATECEQAVQLDAQNSDFHLWLGRALGQKAARASFLNAFSLAKRTRAEFEEAVRLNPRNADALSDLGDFYRQAPGVVGGGIDKAEQIAVQLDKVDPAGAHHLRGAIAEQRKDFTTAESEYKQAVAASPHPAAEWSSLAGFYSRRQRFPDMEGAIHSAATAAQHDKQSSAALYDSAGLLIESKHDPALAVSLLESYLASSSKTEDAPAFVAHLRLARLKRQSGDAAGADRERTAALAMAHEYKPAQEFKSQESTHQEAGF